MGFTGENIGRLDPLNKVSVYILRSSIQLLFERPNPFSVTRISVPLMANVSMRCPSCSTEITFRADPQRMGYEYEDRAERDLEPWRAANLTEDAEELPGDMQLERADRASEEYSSILQLLTDGIDLVALRSRGYPTPCCRRPASISTG